MLISSHESVITQQQKVAAVFHHGDEERIQRLKKAVQKVQPAVCIERALIWTEYHKRPANRQKPILIQMAEALGRVLAEKSIAIYPDELIVGNYTAKRVGGSIYPELHGVPVMLDLLRLARRKTNPLAITSREIRRLLSILPFWAPRFMPLRAYASPKEKLRFVCEQLQARIYLINESGGIAHLAPDYAKLVQVGTQGIIAEAVQGRKEAAPGSEAQIFFDAVIHSAQSLAHFGQRYAAQARTMAASEGDPTRRTELETIVHACDSALTTGATNLHGALQAILLAQIAINLESLDNGICPGRMDQYLYPFYQHDISRGVLTPEGAKTLLAAFCIKLSEVIPVFSHQLTQIHGGLFNGQVVTVGGQDRKGGDATNPLSYLFLEVMESLGMRQPNFHARLHSGSPEKYRNALSALLAGGATSPALYNDDVIIPTMTKHGYTVEDARDYTAVGCVEPVCQGKSLASTDAALFNTPLMLELALNQGRRFGSPIRTGVRTESVAHMSSMAAVQVAFKAQLDHLLGRLVKDLQAIELANRRLHPTPLTSMLLDGCLQKGRCSSAGGATYNYSGIQCVGPVDTGDALYAIERAVFIDKRFTLAELAALMGNNIKDPEALTYLKALPKFGNDDDEVDRWTRYVVDTFVDTLETFGNNTRGGPYTTGLYSVTAHAHFGHYTGALPHGRRRGEPFASGIAPLNGMDRNGPTALINSMNRFDFSRVANGINFNLKFDPHALRGKVGTMALTGLLKTYFRRGGMQTQVNVLDPTTLREARDNPDRFPHLLVRVSGYSAYFNDLSAEIKEELIQRTCQQVPV